MSVLDGKTTLFCGGLSPEVTLEVLDPAFIPFGELVKIQVHLLESSCSISCLTIQLKQGNIKD